MIRQFFVPGQPQGKGRAKVTKVGGYAHGYTPDKTVSYESLIVMAYQEEHAEEKPLDVALRMHIDAIFPLTASDRKNKKRTALMLAGEIGPTKKPDADNIAKVVCDALNKVAYYDDTQIIRLVLTKRYGERPGVFVEISDATEGRG